MISTRKLHSYLFPRKFHSHLFQGKMLNCILISLILIHLLEDSNQSFKNSLGNLLTTNNFSPHLFVALDGQQANGFVVSKNWALDTEP